MIGVSSKGTREEEAKKLAEFLLSKEAQSGGMEEGIPVNKAAYDNIINSTKPGDIALTMGGQFEGDDKFYLLQASGRVLETVPKLVQGSVSEDQAVKAVMKKVNLYLAE